jgi:hypothetical protein
MRNRAQATTAFQGGIRGYEPTVDPISSIFPPQTRVRVGVPRSKWIIDLKDRFDEITSLPRGWDGYDGRPVTFNTAQFAANLIERLFIAGVPTPNVVPGTDGTVQIEWHRNQYDIELDVLGPYEIVAFRRDQRTGDEQELELQTDFTALVGWIDGLSAEQQQDARSM